GRLEIALKAPGSRALELGIGELRLGTAAQEVGELVDQPPLLIRRLPLRRREGDAQLGLETVGGPCHGACEVVELIEANQLVAVERSLRVADLLQLAAVRSGGEPVLEARLAVDDGRLSDLEQPPGQILCQRVGQESQAAERLGQEPADPPRERLAPP